MKMLRVLALVVVVLVVFGGPVLAQETAGMPKGNLTLTGAGLARAWARP